MSTDADDPGEIHPDENRGEISPTAMEDITAIVRDGIIGAAGGFVGTAMMTVVFLVAQALGAFDFEAFADIAGLVGLDAVFGPDLTVAVGYLIFLAGGMVPWPLLFASVERYLPGPSLPWRGVSFGFVAWTGFVLAFYGGQSGNTLYVYAILTLLAHVVYGFGLGLVFEYFATREDIV
ncbi:DUF6789 family protein [Halomarina salina]|uniref:DUF6789 family protein n=1 Tax=Halomarina salina TaxID=1872699 RepID=A0ABD5RRE0_9EURY|nr:DUF6789 family protein [Halomarina salina]